MSMARYLALQPIQHDGVRTEIGGELELADAHAAPLLAIGHIAPQGAIPAAQSSDAPPAAETKANPAARPSRRRVDSNAVDGGA